MEKKFATIKDVAKYMSEATSESDWNKRCDEVKAEFGGYPAEWFSEIVQSGLAGKTARKWNG